MVSAGIVTALSRSRILGANDRIRLGLIGAGNRGDQLLNAFLTHEDVEVAAVSDVYQPYLDFAARKVRSDPQTFRDYRNLLDLTDIDAVIVATPDHWHALHTIHACEAWKDVYVEKPLSLTVLEGRRMVETARRYRRVVQVGTQRRSAPFCREAMEFVRDGGIGKVTAVRCFHLTNEWPVGLGNPSDGEPPPGLDWDLWLGPAPWVPYNRNRSFYRFRWFWHYSGGQLTNFGTHYLDMIHWGLGQDTPLAVTAIGGKFALEDNRQIPDTLEVLWLYPGGTLVSFLQFSASAAPAGLRSGQVEFRGTEGTLYLQSSGFEVVPETLVPNEVPRLTPLDRSLSQTYSDGAYAPIEEKKVTGQMLDAAHARNFLDCIRTREKCNADIEIGHRSTVPTLIGNVAYKTRSYLEWDGEVERFTNNSEANRHLHHDYREPWRLPPSWDTVPGIRPR